MWAMSESKRCPGYADRPAHMVPIVGFNSSGETLDYYCVECRKTSRAYSTSNTIVALVEKYIPRKIRRTHPQRIKMNAFAREVYLSNRTEQELKEFIEEIEDEAWLGTIFPTPPKDDLPAAKPARKRTNLEPLDKLPPEGWVYIIAASRHASIMKIGSTFEYGIRDRLSEAKRWALAGSAVLLHKEWFSRCKQAESLVHKRLDYYRIVSPDAGDELFRTSFEHALANIMIIKNEVENDRKEQAMG